MNIPSKDHMGPEPDAHFDKYKDVNLYEISLGKTFAYFYFPQVPLSVQICKF